MSNSGLRGTTAAQDTRFKDKESKAIKGTKFPLEFERKVDVRKVNLAIMRPWITKTVTDLSGVEDDIVIEYTMELLEDPEKPMPDPKKMQISLVGFLGENAAELMNRLWKLLLSAQDSPGGVPAEFIEAKKAELIAQREAEVKMQEKMMGRGGASGPGTRIHAGYSDDRGGRQGPPSGRGGDGPGGRYDRGPVPRDREGRAFPRGQGAEGYGAGGRRGGQDRYDYTQGGGGGGGGGRRDPPRRYFDDRERDRDRGYDGRRSRRMDDEAPERDVRAMGMRRSSPAPPGPPRRGRDRDDDDSRSRSRSRTPPRRRRSPSRSRSRSRSHSRSRSRSRTPPRRVAPIAEETGRRRRRSPSPSRSRTPPRVVRQRRRSPSPAPPLARGGGGRRRSPSPSTRRAPLPTGRDMSLEEDAPKRSRAGPPQGRAVDRSRSRSRSRSGTPVRRRSDSRTPPAARRAKSPDSRSRSRTPVASSP